MLDIVKSDDWQIMYCMIKVDIFDQCFVTLHYETLNIYINHLLTDLKLTLKEISLRES